MSFLALTPFQQKKYQSIKNKTLAKRYKTYCLATARIKKREEEAKRKASKPPKPPKQKRPRNPPLYPYSDRENSRKWEEQIKDFKLTPKPCSELKVGDVYKTGVDPYFCEVREILPNEILPPYLLVRLKLLPDNLTGEAYLPPSRILLVKE